MKKYFVFVTCIFKMTLGLAPTHQDYFILRQVGQGLWMTRVTNDICEHYDFGGEFTYAKKLKKQFIRQCSHKINKLNLSHADWDHYSFLNLIVQNSQFTCWSTRAVDTLKTPLNIPFCNDRVSFIRFYNSSASEKNDRSIIQKIDRFLAPGDSPIKMEYLWIQSLSKQDRRDIKYLLLGHHGSRTSTSDLLLRRLTNLKMAFASARYAKYRHPSYFTVQKLKDHQVPLIKTEDWGDILIY